MRLKDFFEKTEKLAKDFPEQMAIRNIKKRILNGYFTPEESWPSEWHKRAIQEAKELFDNRGIEYPEG